VEIEMILLSHIIEMFGLITTATILTVRIHNVFVYIDIQLYLISLENQKTVFLSENAQPNVSNYQSFYQPTSTTAVNYCVNNNMSSSTSSLSSVNTVYSYAGPLLQPRPESTGSSNLMVSTAGEHGAQQLPKPVTSHHHQPHHHLGHSHPPLYMSPGIRNQTNHTCMYIYYFLNILILYFLFIFFYSQ